MKVRVWNDDSTDCVEYEGETVEEIIHKADERIKLPGWKNGWSEEIYPEEEEG